MRVRIAAPTPDDVETLFALRTSVRENHQDREELATLGVTPASVAAALAGDARAWIAESDAGEPLGFAMADGAEGTLFALFVRPDAERRGVGRALLAAAEAWLFARGWPEIWLLTGEDPALRAHGVYRAAGWRAVGVEQGQVRYVKRADAGYVVRLLDERSVPPEATGPLLRALVDMGADELTLAVRSLADEPAPVADAFEDALAPFELPPARRRVLVDVEESDGTREVRRWTLSEASVAALLPFVARGLLHHAPSPDGWLEDPAAYRGGELVLGVVSHAREGVLRLRDAEHAALAALGVRARETERSITDFGR